MAVILPQSLQSDLQGSLPVLPNNGNPAGAYNVASAEPGAPQAAAPDPYDWVLPSPYMAEVGRILQQQDEVLKALQLAAIREEPVPEHEPYNWVTRDGNLAVQLLDENRLPMEDEPVFPLTYGEENMPQYRPILPGE